MDDRDLAKMLDDHLYDHRAGNRDCVVCAVILAHHAEWVHHRDVVMLTPTLTDNPLAEYAVQVDERGWMVIRHLGCDKRVAEWPDAQGMWPLTVEHVLDEARIHQAREHDA